METEAYLHGSSSAEQERLALMNAILNARCLEVVAPQPGERVLELGAGTGIFAQALVRRVAPDGSVVAVERDAEQLAAARKLCAGEPSIELRPGDVYAPPLLDEEWGQFDLVHARFLLEHLQRPVDAVRVMVRAVHPDGRIVLIDDDHSLMRFHPDPGGMIALWEDYTRQFEHLGHDAFVGRRLPELIHAAGGRVVGTAQVNYGASGSEPVFAAIAENLAAVVAGARGPILENTSWSAADFDEALERFRRWSERPEATIWYTLPVAIGCR